MITSPFAPTLLSGRRALVTGGGTGLGLAMARELAAAGADLVLVARREGPLAAAAASLSSATGRDVVTAPLDIRDREGVSHLAARLLEQGALPDILINNAGGQFPLEARRLSPNGWRAVIETNLFGTWNMTQVFGDLMLQREGGAICQIIMLYGRGFPGIAHSAAARGGVVELTRSLAYEWGPRVRLNCLAPGGISTSALKVTYDDAVLDTAEQNIPMCRLGTPEEVAYAATFLVSPAASFITGEVLQVAGGQQLQGFNGAIPSFPDRHF